MQSLLTSTRSRSTGSGSHLSPQSWRNVCTLLHFARLLLGRGSGSRLLFLLLADLGLFRGRRRRGSRVALLPLLLVRVALGVVHLPNVLGDRSLAVRAFPVAAVRLVLRVLDVELLDLEARVVLLAFLEVLPLFRNVLPRFTKSNAFKQDNTKVRTVICKRKREKPEEGRKTDKKIDNYQDRPLSISKRKKIEQGKNNDRSA